MSDRKGISIELLSRRKLLRLGLGAGGMAAVSAAGLRGASAYGNYGGGGYGGGTSSPATTAFVDALPIPATMQPVAALSPAPDLSQFQRYAEFPAQKFYDVTQQEGLHQFHRDLPVNTIWGYNGVMPGPTFRARYGEPALVRFRNNLPANSVGFGLPSVITHLHNGHTASESDGFPVDYVDSGQYKDHHYANVYAGVDAFPPQGDPREALGTLWYHDHRIDFTAPNVYKGLAGFFLLFDTLDSGDETDPNPRALRLPSGDYDVPMIFADKRFDANGQLFFDPFDTNGFIGDKFTVNGKIQPYFRVARRKYRLRLLNGGPSRWYEFFLSNGQSFIQISSDGNLLPKPITRQSIRLGVAERVDVIVDFSNVPLNTQIVLQNRLEQTSGRGPTGRTNSPGDAVLRFEVDRQAPAPDLSQVPAVLRDLPDRNTPVAATRTWSFDSNNGAWTVNGKFFDPDVVSARPKRGTAEIWVLRNERRDWSHPIHIHFEEFQILSRNGQTPATDEVARKDVVRLAPGEEVRVYIRFRDFVGRHIMHCHNTIHEDHAMMIRFDIVA